MLVVSPTKQATSPLGFTWTHLDPHSKSTTCTLVYWWYICVVYKKIKSLLHWVQKNTPSMEIKKQPWWLEWKSEILDVQVQFGISIHFTFPHSLKVSECVDPMTKGKRKVKLSFNLEPLDFRKLRMYTIQRFKVVYIVPFQLFVWFERIHPCAYDG